MGAALYVVLEKELPGVDTLLDGKMLSKAEKDLEEAATRLGVRPLMEFFSVSADEVSDLLGDDAAGLDIPAQQWFAAEEGLRTVDALLGEADSSAKLRVAKDDLLDFQRVLREAQKLGARWHLAIDI
jgi:hypothetical protein